MFHSNTEKTVIKNFQITHATISDAKKWFNYDLEHSASFCHNKWLLKFKLKMLLSVDLLTGATGLKGERGLNGSKGEKG